MRQAYFLVCFLLFLPAREMIRRTLSPQVLLVMLGPQASFTPTPASTPLASATLSPSASPSPNNQALLVNFFEKLEGSWRGSGEFTVDSDGGERRSSTQDYGEFISQESPERWDGRWGYCTEGEEAMCVDGIAGWIVRDGKLLLPLSENQQAKVIIISSTKLSYEASFNSEGDKYRTKRTDEFTGLNSRHVTETIWMNGKIISKSDLSLTR